MKVISLNPIQATIFNALFQNYLVIYPSEMIFLQMASILLF